jgi:hypothetical protein
MIQEVMERMMSSSKVQKLASIQQGKRETKERLPGFESMEEFNDHRQVRSYELGLPMKMDPAELKGAAKVMRAQQGHLSGMLARAFTAGIKSKQLALPSSKHSAHLVGGIPSMRDHSFKPRDDERTSEYNKEKRRHMFPTIPGAGTFDRNFNIAAVEENELARARDMKYGGLVRTFYIATFGKVHERCHHNSINQVVMSFDEKRVASASSDSTIRLWDTKSGSLVTTLKGHEHGVHTVAFSDEVSYKLPYP